MFYRLILTAGRGVLNFIYAFHKLAPVKNRISFVSRQNSEPSADIRMLAEELKRQDPGVEIVISCRMIDPGLKAKVRYVLHMITEQMHLFAVSKVVILDGYCISACMLHHRKDLKILQMWHAMGALKKFGCCTIGEEEGYSPEIAEGMRMHKNYSTVFVSSEACKPLMAPAFGCDESIMKVMPLPRTDLIVQPQYVEENRERIFARYPSIRGKKVILYAPTFRKNEDIHSYVESLIMAVDYERYSLIIKLHPLDREKIDYGKAILDFDFSTIEMYSAADYVITDYSAVFFEAALAGKPLFRYVPDFERYGVQRGLMDIYPDAPGPISKDTRAVIKAIEEEDYDLEAVKAFGRKYIEAGKNNTAAMAAYILKYEYRETTGREFGVSPQEDSAGAAEVHEKII